LDDQTNASEVVSAEVNISTAPILLTHVSAKRLNGNSSGSVNTPVILYDVCASYINVVLKEYPHLFLYNNGKFQVKYKFKNSGMCLGCEKEHNKREVVGQLIDDSYNIKCLFSSCGKEIKINASPEVTTSKVSTLSTTSSSQINKFNKSRLPIFILPEDPEEK
jgi:hypothetical protein